MTAKSSKIVDRIIKRRSIKLAVGALETLITGETDREVTDLEIEQANKDYRRGVVDVKNESLIFTQALNEILFNLGNDVHTNNYPTKNSIVVHGRCEENLEHRIKPSTHQISESIGVVINNLNDEQIAILYSPNCSTCGSTSIPIQSITVIENEGGFLTRKYTIRIKTGSLTRKINDKMYKIYELTDALTKLEKVGYTQFPEKETREFYDALFSDKKPKNGVEILDFVGLRFYADTIIQCRQIYGVLEEMEEKGIIKILRDLRKDYITEPKKNNYQSDHVFIMHDGRPYEIQIRTYDMDDHAENGIAAHADYKTANDLAREIVGVPYTNNLKELDRIFDLSPVN